MIDKIKNYILLIRPHHYLKNLFIFAPLFFALEITDLNLLVKCFIASIAFSLIAGVVYIINDINDVKEDRVHPKKKFRPIASNKVSIKEALIIGSIILILGNLIAFLISPIVWVFCIIYFVMNLAYSFKLKHIAILDIFIISIGFVIRLFVGAAATGVPLTNWIVILAFLLAIFLSLAKRRDDVLIFNQTGEKLRKSIDGYNEKFLDSAIVVSVSVMLVSYILYTISPEIIAKFNNDKLYLTSIFVVFGVFRYMQLTFVENKTGSPVGVLLRDRLIQLSVIGWIISFGLIIYKW